MDFDQTTETNIELSAVNGLSQENPSHCAEQVETDYPDLTEQSQNISEELEPTLEIEHPILSGFWLVGGKDC